MLRLIGPAAVALLFLAGAMPAVIAVAAPDPLLTTLRLPEDATALAAADLDLDGDLDLVVGGVVHLTILWNSGRGFEDRTTVPGAVGSPLTVADLTFDGLPDVYGPGGLYANTGATFVRAAGIPGGLAAGDMENDRDLDYATLAGNLTRVHLNAGGHFRTISLEVGAKPSTVRMADIDNVAGPEVLVLNGAAGRLNKTSTGSTGGVGSFFNQRLPANSVSVLMAPGGILGAALQRVDCATGNDPVDLAVGDLDDDALPDLVTANRGDDTVSILSGKSLVGGIGQDFLSSCLVFEKHADYKVAGDPRHVALADVDLDRDLDIITLTKPFRDGRLGGRSEGFLSVLRNNGDRTFGSLREYRTGGPGLDLAVGSVVGNRDPDILVLAGSTVTILQGDHGTYSAGGFPGQEFLSPVAVAIGAIGLLVAERSLRRSTDDDSGNDDRPPKHARDG